MTHVHLRTTLLHPVHARTARGWRRLPGCFAMALLAIATAGSDARAEEPVADAPVRVLSGTVVNADQSPAAGAIVEVLTGEKTITATVDAQGAFELHLPPGAPLRGLTVIARSADGEQMAAHDLPWTESPAAQSAIVALTLAPVVKVAVRVIDGDSNPVADALVGVTASIREVSTATSDKNGEAILRAPPELLLQTIYARKAGYGLDYRALYNARDYYQQQQAGVAPTAADILPKDTVVLTLAAPRPITVQLTDDDGQPLQDISVYPWYFQKPDQPNNFNMSGIVSRVQQRTDATGAVRFDWFPAWQFQPMVFWTNADGFQRVRGEFNPQAGSDELSLRLQRLVAVRGAVRYADDAPAAGIPVAAHGAGYQSDDFRGSATTDDAGRYEILVAPEMMYLLIAGNDQWGSQPQTGFAVRTKTPVEGIDFTLRPATRIFGRVTVGEDQQPAAGQRVMLRQPGANNIDLPDLLSNPEGSRRYLCPTMYRQLATDADGRFEFHVGSGQFQLSGPTQTQPVEFDVTDQTELEFNFAAEREEEGHLRGLVVAGDPPQPVGDARVEGVLHYQSGRADLQAVTDTAGRFERVRLRHPMVIFAATRDRTLAGLVEIGPDDDEATIAIAPTGSATGRALDVDGAPLAGIDVVYGIRVNVEHLIAGSRRPFVAFSYRFGGTAVTDNEGRFQLSGLVIDQKYELNLPYEKDGTIPYLGAVTLTSTEPVDLGDLKKRPPAEPYKPPTLQERIASAFHIGKTPEKRLAAARDDAEIGHLRVLLLFADAESPQTEAFYKVRFEDREVSRTLDNYRFISLDTTGEEGDAVRAFAAAHDITLPPDGRPLLVAQDFEGSTLAVTDCDPLQTDAAIDPAKVMEWLQASALPPLDAEVLLASALARARSENKRVLVKESATWCGPCWSLSRFLHAHEELFAKDYLIVPIDHRWANQEAVMERLHPEGSGGIPWFVILDADGNRLITSDGPDGNIGFPGAGEPEGIEHFLKMLDETRIQLTDDDLAALRTALESP